eukprot:3214413-Amphidinium_carterae.1
MRVSIVHEQDNGAKESMKRKLSDVKSDVNEDEEQEQTRRKGTKPNNRKIAYAQTICQFGWTPLCNQDTDAKDLMKQKLSE